MPILKYLIFTVLLLLCGCSQTSSRPQSSDPFQIRSCSWESFQTPEKKYDFVIIEQSKQLRADVCKGKTCYRIQSPHHHDMALRNLCRQSYLFLRSFYTPELVLNFGHNPKSNRKQTDQLLESLMVKNQIICFQSFSAKKGVCHIGDIFKKYNLELYLLDSDNQPSDSVDFSKFPI